MDLTPPPNQPALRRDYILAATALFLVVAGLIWYFDLTRAGDVSTAAKAECQPYVDWRNNIIANYSCTRLDGGCVIGGAFYKPCPSISQGLANFNFTNKSA